MAKIKIPNVPKGFRKLKIGETVTEGDCGWDVNQQLFRDLLFLGFAAAPHETYIRRVKKERAK